MQPIPILLYHRIDTSGDPHSTPPEDFARHLAWLAGRGYRTLTLDAFEHALAQGGAPKRAVLITFDDGGADLQSAAAPLLRAHGFSAVAFLITGWLNGEQSIDTDQVPLTWDGARSLLAEGRFEFQTHTHSHALWPIEAGAKAPVAADLAASIDTLAGELRLPRASFRHLAWPWGRCNLEWERTASRVGLAYQYLVQRGAVMRTSTLRLPRACFDGVSPRSFARWLPILSSAPGARVVNRLFGKMRELRRGIGYQ